MSLISMRVALTLGFGTALAGGVALAQSTTSAPALEEGKLEEIVVTAERRTVDLQRTPVAVSVRQGAELQAQGKFTLSQILEGVPSVGVASPPTEAASIVSDSPASAIAIRGVQSSGQVRGKSSSMVPAVAAYVDGVVNGLGGSYDLNRVEVLRGPQGTLYGRSATAGVVNIFTSGPNLGSYGGNTLVEVGNANLQHYSAAVNVPIDDLFALRLSGNYYKRDGYDAPIGGSVDTLDGRAKLLFKPSDGLSMLLGFAAQNNKERSGEYASALSGTGTDDVAFGLLSYNGQTYIGSGYSQQRQYWAQIDWDLGPATLTYIPALRTFTQDTVSYSGSGDGLTINGITPSTIEVPDNKFHTEELRLTSNSTTPLQWQAGVFYYRNDLTLNAATVLASGSLLSSSSPHERLTEQVGLFAESTYSFASNTRVTAGLRGDYTHIQTREHACSDIPFPSCTDLGGSEGKRIWRNLTYKARVEQDLTPNNLVYGSISSAFLPGDVGITTGTNGLAVAPYEPETLTSLELGSKNRFLEDRLQVNGDVFYYWYGSHQVGVQVGAAQSGPPLYTTMGSPARMVGAELEVLYQPTRADRLGLNLSYTDAWYIDKPTEFANGVGNSQFSGVVPWIVNPSYSRTFFLPADQALTFFVEAVYRSSYLVSDIPVSPTNYYPIEDYFWNGDVVQGNATLTWKLGQFSVSGYVRNVTDVRYKTVVNVSSVVATENTAALSEPRTFGVVLSASF